MSRYSATLLDHAMSPRNGGALESPDAVGKASLGGRAPYVTIYLLASQGVVTRAMFQTYGCGVSIACCSALTEMIAGSPIADCQSLTGLSLIENLAGIPEEKLFCAHMAVEALQEALAQLVASDESYIDCDSQQ